jgi:hypothetical protein
MYNRILISTDGSELGQKGVSCPGKGPGERSHPNYRDRAIPGLLEGHVRQ